MSGIVHGRGRLVCKRRQDLAHLARFANRTAILGLGTFRPPFRALWLRALWFHHLGLDHLGALGILRALGHHHLRTHYLGALGRLGLGAFGPHHSGLALLWALGILGALGRLHLRTLDLWAFGLQYLRLRDVGKHGKDELPE